VAAGLERFEEMRRRFRELEARPPAPADPNLASYYEELGGLQKRLRGYDEYLSLAEQLEQAEAVAADDSQDEEFRELAREEVVPLRERTEELRKKLLVDLVAGEGAGRKSAILEVRAGTGGEEAALFAGDLYRMYRRYIEGMGWNVENLDASPSDLGGFKEIIFRVEGKDAYSRLRFEAGTHRVQRVPRTESQGRIHTSAATVAVMTEPGQVELKIPEADLEVSVMRSQGPGGQGVNTTDSCVRILHTPSGIAVKCMVERSQHRNKALAMKILRARLMEMEERKAAAERTEARRSQIGSGDRSGRIRTYNFPQNRVTDHRLEDDRNFSLEKIIDGDLGGLIDRLIEQAASSGQRRRPDRAAGLGQAGPSRPDNVVDPTRRE
jgi:peptide chain release factor 1